MYDKENRKVKFREWDYEELHATIYNLLKEEFKIVSKGSFANINPNNPYYLLLLGVA